jgi:hypothetical protein
MPKLYGDTCVTTQPLVVTPQRTHRELPKLRNFASLRTPSDRRRFSKLRKIGLPGFEFRRVSGHLSRRGATFKYGRGQVSGGQPGTPKKPPFSRFRSVRCERVSSPLPRMQSATVIGDYGFCWGWVEDCCLTRVLSTGSMSFAF